MLRWGVKVTFEEGRRHLDLETQRQWSDLASLHGVVFAGLLDGDRLLLETGALPLRRAAWYKKPDATFSDVLAYVRRAICANRNFVNSTPGGEALKCLLGTECGSWPSSFFQSRGDPVSPALVHLMILLKHDANQAPECGYSKKLGEHHERRLGPRSGCP